MQGYGPKVRNVSTVKPLSDLQAGDTVDVHPQLGERYWTTREIAGRWRVSVDTVVRLFEHEPDVLILVRPMSRQKRRYRTVRIPDGVLTRVQELMSVVDSTRVLLRSNMEG
jgi:hypothetical protein